MNVLGLSKVLFPLSVAAMVASVAVLLFWSPRLSIEFTGGTRIEVRFESETTREQVESAVAAFPEDIGAIVTSTTESRYFIRTKPITVETHDALLAHLGSSVAPTQELQYTTIGPSVGTSLQRRSLLALTVAVVAILLYIAVSFRKIPRQLSPWLFGLSAVVALVHDLLIKVGIFAVLSHFTTFEIDTLFVTALLSTMGYSVNDKIVIMDRMRDNLKTDGRHADLPVLIEKSLQQSLSRTLMTGTGALITMFCLYFLGAQSIQWFILALIVGTVIGTYSSFFVAPPLLVLWQKKRS